MQKLRLGIIGLGERGKAHFQNCFNIKDAEVVAVADASRKAVLCAKELGIRCYAQYEDLLNDKSVDAVIISLPNFLHAESAIKACEAGKDIFIEKPLARNVEEGKSILSSVNRHGVRFMVGFDLRFKPKLKKLRAEILEGTYGKVELAQGTNVGSGPFSERRGVYGPTPVPEWWFDRGKVGGGALLDLGCHIIDLFTWYFGEVQTIHSYLGHTLNMEVEDLAVCKLRFKDGPVAIISSGWFSRTRLSYISVFGAARSSSMNLSPVSTRNIVWNDIRSRLRGSRDTSEYLELEHFVTCLLKDDLPHPSASEGLVNLQIIESAYLNSDSS